MPIESLLAGLTAAQRQAVVTERAPLCVVAGAGAGKTRVLTSRIAYRVAAGTAEADHVLALTFTRKAAGELAGRIRGLGVRQRLTAGTFHGVAYAQLRTYWADRGRSAPVLLDRKAGLLGRLIEGRPQLDGVSPADLAGDIEWAKARLVTPDRYEEATARCGRRTPVPPPAMAALYARYETEKRRRRLADFDDLLADCASALEQDAGFAASQRWRWRHFFVDEFQDVNPLQHRLLSAWLGDGADLCVVGDPNQAIYAWNGTDPALLSTFADRWPGAEVVTLDANHRCSPQVVAAARAALGPHAGGSRSSCPDGPAPTVRCYPTDAAEARGVATELRRAHGRGRTWSQLAVLMRTNAQAPAFAEELRAAQVPFRLAGLGSLADHPVVKTALAEVCDKRLPFAMVARDLAELAAAAGREAADLADHQASPPVGRVNAERAAALATLSGMVKDYQRLDAHPSVEGFSTWLRAASRRDRVEEESNAVTVCTFHRAKGLEWQAVWVTGLEAGLVPIGHATTTEARDEERRLLYVALTRAAQELHCSWSEQRTFAGRRAPREPSPWLAGLVDAAIAAAGPAGGGLLSWQDQLASQRDRLARCRRPSGGSPVTDSFPAADPTVLAGLRGWRSAAARAAGVPPYLLFHDITLTALAAVRPATIDDLLAVPGLGPVKVARYGTTLLNLVAGQAATA